MDIWFSLLFQNSFNLILLLIISYLLHTYFNEYTIYICCIRKYLHTNILLHYLSMYSIIMLDAANLLNRDLERSILLL